MEDLLLVMQGIDKSFPGVHALDHVNFDVRRGEVHALMGENGAVTQAPNEMGRLTIDLLLDVARGMKVEDTDTGSAFYSIDNIDDPDISRNLYQ